MTVEELRVAIENYPSRLAKAMQDVAKAEQAIEQLEEHIAEEEAQLAPIPQIDEQTSSSNEEMRLKLDHELSLLELHAEKIRGEIELEYRRKPPQGEKVTEATVSAFVKSNPRFVQAKEQCLKKKLERETCHIARRMEFAAQRTAMRQPEEPLTSPKLLKLREKLLIARMTLEGAETRLEEIKASLVPYQLLTQLYTAGLVKA